MTSPPGVWYLVNPRRGTPATGRAQLQLETAPVGGTGPNATVLAATMNNDFSAFPDASFPVYTLSRDRGRERGDLDSHDWGHESACQGLCAVYWPPLLTSERPVAGPGVDQHALGFIVRPDGSHQVTYHGRPLYLFNKDAYIGPPVGAGPGHLRSGYAHAMGRVQHDPAAALGLPTSRARKAPAGSTGRGFHVGVVAGDTEPCGFGDRLDAVRDAELAENRRDVVGDGLLGQEEAVRDLGVVAARPQGGPGRPARAA